MAAAARRTAQIRQSDKLPTGSRARQRNPRREPDGSPPGGIERIHLQIQPPDAARKMLLLKLGIGLPAPSDPALRAETTQKAAELDAAYGRGQGICPDANPDHCLGIDDLEHQDGPEPRSKGTGGPVGGLARGRQAHARRLCAPGRAEQPGRARAGLCRHRRAVALAVRHDPRRVSGRDRAPVDPG